jgi:orotidine-5'-phosphate decarboxylase
MQTTVCLPDSKLLQSKKYGIIFALDVTPLQRAVELALDVAKYVDVIKVGLPLIISDGGNAIRSLKKETNLPVIADLKISDVPEIAGRVAASAFRDGADAVTVQGFLGPSSIEECVRQANEGQDVIVITESTHPDAMLFMEPVSTDIATLAEAAGAAGIQAPGNRIKSVVRLRHAVSNRLYIVSCGIGFQGGKVGSALAAGADFEIIGRAIYAMKDPVAAAREICQKIKTKGKIVEA